MTTLEEINLVVMAHDCVASEPTVISPLSVPSGMAFPGVAVIATSIDVFNAEPPGAPTDALVCFATGNVSALLGEILEERRRQQRQMVAMAVRVDDPGVRRALGEDLAARIHMNMQDRERAQP